MNEEFETIVDSLSPIGYTACPRCLSHWWSRVILNQWQIPGRSLDRRCIHCGERPVRIVPYIICETCGSKEGHEGHCSSCGESLKKANYHFFGQPYSILGTSKEITK